MRVDAYIALGSNISRREAYLSAALNWLDEHDSIEVIKKSAVYETAPVGYIEQNDFLNMAVKIHTSLSAVELLDYCQAIENELGRKRVVKWGPRTIDLDILLYNHENMKAERLTIPHPHMHERAFVIVPLAEVAPNMIIPNLELTASQIVSRLPEDDVQSMTVWGKI